MASKVKKGFLYYIAWLLFFAVGFFCIFACVLIFNPGVDVFGINFRYVTDSRIVEINKVDETTSLIQHQSFSKINVNCGFSNVSVVQDKNYEVFTIFVNKKIVGFASSDQIKYSVSTTITDGALNIVVTEPQMSVKLSPTANIIIYCPKSSSFANYDINIKTDSGNVSFGYQEDYLLTAKSINVETNSGSVRLNEKTAITSGDVNITTKSGAINVFNNIGTQLNINTTDSKIFVKNITGSLNVAANEIKAKCTTVGGNVKFSSKKGYIYIDNLGTVEANNTGNFSAEPDVMHIANIIIGKMAGDVSLPNAANSDITIDELYGKANIITTSGAVNIKKAFNDVSIKTTKGSVKLTQMSTQRTNITTATGAVTANFEALGAQTDIKTEKANITVNLKDGLLAKINYSAKKKVAISWITTALENAGTILLPNTEESTTNVMNLTTLNSGSIYINNGFTVEQ